MPITKVICPHCQVTLRSPTPLEEGQALRCSGCGQRFQATATAKAFTATTPHVPVEDEDVPSVPLTRRLLPFIAAVCGIFFLVGGGIAVVAWVGHRPAPVAGVDPDKQRRMEEEEKRVDAQRKELDEARAKLALETRKTNFARLIMAGDFALTKKAYTEAEGHFYEALKLFPDDAAAKAGLTKAQTGAALANQLGQDKENRQAQFDQFMTTGREKMAAKQYAEAMRNFEAALVLIAGDRTAAQSLLEAKEALAKNGEEQKKLDKYNAHMTAARAAMLAKRYVEAAKEFRAALLVIPSDGPALDGRREADRMVDAAADVDTKTQTVQQEMNRAQAALDAKRYNLAVKILNALVKATPDVPEAAKMLKDAKKAKAKAQADCDPLVALGTAALNAGRIEEAIGNFRDAVKVLADDDTAVNGLQTAQKALSDLQVAQAAYQRYMGQGQVGLDNKQYTDALAAFGEALRLFPKDIRAQTGYNLAAKGLKVAADQTKKYDRLVNVANTAVKQRQWLAAIQAANDALLLNPNDQVMPAVLTQARYGKAMDDGKLALQLRRYPDAIRSFQDALTQKPNDTAASSFLNLARGMAR